MRNLRTLATALALVLAALAPALLGAMLAPDTTGAHAFALLLLQPPH